MDERARKTIRSIFPEGFGFPAPGSISGEDLAGKLDEIEEVLEKNSILLDLKPELSDDVAYERFVVELLDREIPPGQPASPMRIAVCEGSCPDCFRKNHCNAAGELEADDFL